MSFFRYDTFCKYLAIIEQSIDVNKYSVDRIHVWPILRFVLCNLLQDDVEPNKEKNSKIKNTLNRVANSIHHKFDSIKPNIDLIDQIDTSLLTRRNKGIIEDKSNKKKTVLFIGRTDDYTVEQESGWYSPIIDSWYEIAQNEYSVLKAEIFEGQVALDLSPRVIPPVLIHPSLTFTTPKDELLFESLREKLRLLIEAISRFSTEELGINIKPEPVQQNAESVLLSAMSIRNCLKPFLTKLDVNTVMMGCSYYYLGYGVHWAAAELSVTSVELQHGAIGGHHFGYTHCTSIPSSGYILLPKVLNLWGIESAKYVLRWLPQDHKYHRVVIGGKTLLTEQMLDHRSVSKLQELKQQACLYQKVILVSLSGREYVSLTENLIVAIRDSPKDWLWLIRSHPLAQRMSRDGHDPLRVQQILTEFGINNYEVDNTTFLPLDTVLALSDHHVTHFSSVYLEATVHAVPTTFIHPTAETLFKKQIETGSANLAVDPKQIIESIKNFTLRAVFNDPNNNEINTDKGWRIKVLKSIIK
ncbi:MAG: hypothetical protein CMJ80_00550 [Planctomycetaceae bacterium]|nr:hypothetical protein [Planctomycetaceae bacterium]